MSRLTRRDAAVLLVVVLLVLAIVVFALLDLTGWAIAGLAVLIGVSTVLAHAQFIARRALFQLLRRDSRATRENTARMLRLATTTLDRVNAVHGGSARTRDVLRADVADARTALGAEVAGSAAALRADVADTRTTLGAEVADARSALHADVAHVSAETAALRAELRGVRVSQQLFSQALGGVRTRVEQIMPRLEDTVTNEELAELADLADLSDVDRVTMRAAGASDPGASSGPAGVRPAS